MRIVAGLVMMAFLLCATPLVLACVLSLLTGPNRWWLMLAAFPVVLAGWLLIVAGCGSFTRVQVDRTKLLDPCVLLTRFFACIPTRKQTIHLRDFKAVWTDYRLRSNGRTTYDEYTLYLGGEYVGDRDLICVFRGSNDNQMRVLCDFLTEAANLEVKRK